MRDVKQDIRDLQSEIIHEENLILEYMRLCAYSHVRKSLATIESDLKYLSILANGAPIDKKEDRKIMDFLRIHYDNLKNLSVPA